MSASPPASARTSVAPISALTAAELRLSTLWQLVHGANATSSSSSSSSVGTFHTPAMVRLGEVVHALTQMQRAGGAGKPIARLLDHWDRYAHLLQPLSEASTSTLLWDPIQQAIYLISQHSELSLACNQLQETQLLVQQHKLLDSDSGRSLSRSISGANKVRLAHEQSQAKDEIAQSAALQKRMLQLVHNWSDYTATLSRAFTLLDTELVQLERQLAALTPANAHPS